MNLVGALPLPNLSESANKWKVKQVNQLLDQVAAQLTQGENFLIYPSGRLKLSQEEVVGGASFVANLLKACPEANVVLVRTTGMWGSLFSKAPTGTTPDFGKTLWQGVKILLKNGLFFCTTSSCKHSNPSCPCRFPL